eukprot:1613023-Pyramimonas_sp.AAC.1
MQEAREGFPRNLEGPAVSSLARGCHFYFSGPWPKCCYADRSSRVRFRPKIRAARAPISHNEPPTLTIHNTMKTWPH